MYLSEFISANLKYNFPTFDCRAVCKMCGKNISSGVKQKDIIKKSFNDHQYLRYSSDFLCIECCSLLGQVEVRGADKPVRLTYFSFINTRDHFRILKREKLWDCILTPPAPPFVFCVTYSNKKHIAFKAEIQYDSSRYRIYTDKGEVLIELDKIGKLIKIIQNWYTVLPEKKDTKQQPTWLTKGEILQGGRNYKNIKAYDIQKYQEENLFIEKYRETALLKLLVFALNKKYCEIAAKRAEATASQMSF